MATNARDRQSPILAEVASQLRAEAARKRMSLREVSRRSGVPYPTTQKSFAGVRMIDVAELAAFCYAIGVRPSELFERITDSDPDDDSSEKAG